MFLKIARSIQNASHRIERTPAAFLHWPLFWIANGFYAMAAVVQRAEVARTEAIVSRTPLVRDGIWFIFIETDNGNFQINAQRRTRPFLKATFVADKQAGEAWRDHGIVPAGESAELFEQFRAGTWPPPLPGSG